MTEPAVLVLEDGRAFHGERFGAPLAGEGEVVFSTSMTGYQEMCTDPSYHGQILCLTYPLVGNYGTQTLHDQSARPWVSGLVVRDHARHPSHYGSEGTLDEYLRARGVPGISGVDTRALTRHIRSLGARRGVILSGTELDDMPAMVGRARTALLPSERQGVAEVSGMGIATGRRDVQSNAPTDDLQRGPRVVVIDCGLKANIVRSLATRGLDTVVVPYSASAEEIRALAPDGVVTSPGPGDPQDAEAAIRTVGAVVESGVPFFGICLGHQVLGLAIGATTSKLKYGHRGGNHPVRDVATGRVRITAQNHGYGVDADSVPFRDGWRVSHVNVNDGSVEGLVHAERPAFSVQFHPEGAPGPEDHDYLWDHFLALVGDRSREER